MVHRTELRTLELAGYPEYGLFQWGLSSGSDLKLFEEWPVVG